MAVLRHFHISHPMHKLLIIPCCARKRPGGEKVGVHAVQLEDVVSSEAYADVLSGRADVLSAVRSKPRYLSGKYSKNASIQDGPDFGGDRLNGLYVVKGFRTEGVLV